jgi:nitroreductase
MSFNSIRKTILERRNIKPEFMNGRIIADDDIHELIELANWAPTHGHTEPWRFVVFSGAGLEAFSQFHAELYREAMESEGKPAVKYQKILGRAAKSSHLIAIGMRRGDHPKIPENEEHLSAGIAAYIIWLGAAAKGMACYWGSGGMTYHPEMKKFLGWDADEDRVLGFLYLGYTDSGRREGRRISGISEKVEWRK